MICDNSSWYTVRSDFMNNNDLKFILLCNIANNKLISSVKDDCKVGTLQSNG